MRIEYINNNILMKWQLNQIIRKVNETPTFLYDKNLVSSTLKDTDTSNNTTLPSYYGDTMDLLTACEKGLVPKEKLTHFCQLNIIKYVLRYKNKGGISDLQKARTYLEKLIAYESNEE